MKIRNVIAMICVLALAGSVSAAVPTPIAYFPFDTLNAGVTPNAVDGANNGTVNGGAALVGGKYGNALDFDGVDDQVYVPGGLSSLSGFTGQMSIAFWIKGHVGNGSLNGVNYPVIAIENTTAAFALDPGITIQGTGSTPRMIWDIPAIRMLPSPLIDRDLVANVTGDDWHHFAFTSDKTGGVNPPTYMHMYIDGQLVASGGENYVNPNAATITFYQIGSNIPDSSWLEGALDDVAVWDVALTQEQILEFSGIPEPATLSLLGIGLILPLVARRRRSA